jgi:hypothetical protein
MRISKRKALWASLLSAWAGCVGVGLAALLNHSSTPGERAALPVRWPAGLPFQPQSDGPTLIVCLHPHCPCSRATMGELARLLTRQANHVNTYLLLDTPTAAPDRAALVRLWDQVRHIPAVIVMPDPNGSYAKLLGARTSGQVFVFDSSGRGMFSGGITPARGHMGDSAGGDAVARLLSGRESDRQGAPVFGCPLEGPPDISGAKP